MKSFVSGVFLILIAAGCGGETTESKVTVIEETGLIEEGDLIDADYGGYRYDPYVFQVNPLDQVTVEIEAEDFQPILCLYEVSTGAHLAEWDAEYSDDPALSYRIAGGGDCEARVYAPGGTGSYTVKITVEGN